MGHIFHVGQHVRKVTGDYKISGVVRSVFQKENGETRLVVEHFAEGGGSFLHIYGPSNLMPDDPHAEYILIQDDMQVAGCEGPAEEAWREIQHYAATYREEGPVRIERVLRIPVEVE